jgi:hypothetical protein
MSSKYIKNEQGWFVCPSCNVVKQNQNTMYYHMKKHEGKLPYECNICKKDFIQKTSLELHMLSKHKDKNTKKSETFKCPFDNCEFEALTKANRRIHCLRKHFKDEISNILEENSTCSACKGSFLSNTSFYYHALGCIRVNSTEKQKLIELIN